MQAAIQQQPNKDRWHMIPSATTTEHAATSPPRPKPLDDNEDRLLLALQHRYYGYDMRRTAAAVCGTELAGYMPDPNPFPTSDEVLTAWRKCPSVAEADTARLVAVYGPHATECAKVAALAVNDAFHKFDMASVAAIVNSGILPTITLGKHRRDAAEGETNDVLARQPTSIAARDRLADTIHPPPETKRYPPIEDFIHAAFTPAGIGEEDIIAAYIHRRCPYLAASGFVPKCAHWMPADTLFYDNGIDITATEGDAVGAIAWEYNSYANDSGSVSGFQLEPLTAEGERLPYIIGGKEITRRTFHTIRNATATCYMNLERYRQGGGIVIAEAPLDALAAAWLAAEDGIKVAVAIATGGTAGMKAIPSGYFDNGMANTIHVYDDGDEAGKEAANALAQTALAANREVVIHSSPEGEDACAIAFNRYTSSN